MGYRGLVLLQVGTAFVTPTDGQLYDPTDGAVTVPTEVPDVPYVLGCVVGVPVLVVYCTVEILCLMRWCFLASAANGAPANPTVTRTAIASLIFIMVGPFLYFK